MRRTAKPAKKHYQNHVARDIKIPATNGSLPSGNLDYTGTGQYEQVTCRIERITPAKAAAYLEASERVIDSAMVRNRTLRISKFARLKEAIRAGEFVFNGEPIVFGVSGRLLDGQHRLRACVETEIAIDVLVVRNVPDKVYPSYDQGAQRSGSDVLSIDGRYENCVALAAAITVVTRIEKGEGGLLHHKHAVPPTEILEVVDAHPGIQESVKLASNNYKTEDAVLPPAGAGALHYLFSKHDPELASFYIMQLMKGVNIEEDSVAYVVRKRLQQMMRDRSARANYPDRLAVAIRGWNALRQGRSLSYVQYNPRTQDFPTIQ